MYLVIRYKDSPASSLVELGFNPLLNVIEGSLSVEDQEWDSLFNVNIEISYACQLVKIFMSCILFVSVFAEQMFMPVYLFVGI